MAPAAGCGGWAALLAGFIVAGAVASGAGLQAGSAAGKLASGYSFAPVGVAAKGAEAAALQFEAETEAASKRARRRWPLDASRVVGSAFVQGESEVAVGPWESLAEAAAATQLMQVNASSADAEGPDDIVQHLTHRLSEVSGRIDRNTGPEQRLAALRAAQPVLLQLQHAVRATAPVESEDNSVDVRPDKAARCFACIYIMQRVAQHTAPYYSPTASNYGVQDLAGEFGNVGKAPHGLPVSFPSRSAYAANRAPLAIENGPFTQFAGPEAAAGLAHASMRRVVTEPSSAAPPKGVGAQFPGMNPVMWPSLQYGDGDGGGGDGGGGDAGEPATEEVAEDAADDAASFLEIANRQGPPRDPMTRAMSWGSVPVEAYLLHHERPPIGPRMPPPIPTMPEEVVQVVGGKQDSSTPPAPEMSRPVMTQPMPFSLGTDPPAPPALVPRALFRALDDGGPVQPPRVPYVPGLGFAPKQDMSMLDAPQFPVDARVVDKVPTGGTDPLMHIVPAGSLLQTGGTPDEDRGEFGQRPPWMSRTDQAAGSAEPLHEGRHPQMQGSRDGVSEPKPDAVQPPTTAAVAEDDLFGGPKPESGIAPNTALFASAGAGKSSPLEEPGKGVFERLGKALKSVGKKKGEQGSTDDWHGPWVEATRKEILKAQERRSPPEAASPILPHKKVVPFGASFDGGEGADRFDQPQDIAQVETRLAKEKTVDGKLKAEPFKKPILTLSQGDQEAGLFDKPRTERDAFNEKPVVLEDSPKAYEAVKWKEKSSLLQQQGRAEDKVRRNRRRHAAHSITGGAAGGLPTTSQPESQAAGRASSGGTRDAEQLKSIAATTVEAAAAVSRRLQQPDAVTARNSIAAGFASHLKRGQSAAQQLLDKMRERYRPMPHKCRSGEKICRQRLRAPTPYAMRRKLRRTMTQSRTDELMSSWRRAIDRMCTVNPALGQPLPPKGDEEVSGSASWEPDFQALQRALEKTASEIKHDAKALKKFVGKVDVQALMRGDEAAAFGIGPKSTKGDDPNAVLKLFADQAKAAIPGVRKAMVKKEGKKAEKLMKEVREAAKAIDDFHKAAATFRMWQSVKTATRSEGAAESAATLAAHAKRMIAELVSLTQHVSAFGPVRSGLRAFDSAMESGYEGPRPPPRLQSEGMDSAGKVRSQPFTAWVTEPNRFGDNAAIGQLTDLGMPVAIQRYCNDVDKQLELLADLYLHGYDLEEMCVIANVCPAKQFSVMGRVHPTSVKGRMFSRMA